MPHKCPCCDGWGKRPKRNAEGNWEDTDCPSCSGTGVVWDKQAAAPSYPYWGPYTYPYTYPNTVPQVTWCSSLAAAGNQKPLGVVTNGTVWTNSNA